jgi:hypothetical protein
VISHIDLASAYNEDLLSALFMSFLPSVLCLFAWSILNN